MNSDLIAFANGTLTNLEKVVSEHHETFESRKFIVDMMISENASPNEIDSVRNDCNQSFLARDMAAAQADAIRNFLRQNETIISHFKREGLRDS